MHDSWFPTFLATYIARDIFRFHAMPRCISLFCSAVGGCSLLLLAVTAQSLGAFFFLVLLALLISASYVKIVLLVSIVSVL